MKVPLLTACLCCALIVILSSGGCTANTKDQEYYDNRVAAEPDNAEAWCIRGMYYNDNYGQCQRRNKIPHFRRCKIPHLRRNKIPQSYRNTIPQPGPT